MKLAASIPATILAVIVTALVIPLEVAALVASGVALTALLYVLRFSRVLRKTAPASSYRSVQSSVIEGEFHVVERRLD